MHWQLFTGMDTELARLRVHPLLSPQGDSQPLQEYLLLLEPRAGEALGLVLQLYAQSSPSH